MHKNKMKKLIRFLFGWLVSGGLLFLLFSVNPTSANNDVVTNNFWQAISQSTTSISKHLDEGPTNADMKAGASDYIINKVINILFPVIIVIWILIAMVGLYTILTNPDKMKEGMTMIISGMIGIVFMYSARYISYEVFNTLWKTGSPDPQGIKVMELIKNMYDKILYPFIKIAVYFSLGILVIIMMSRVFTYITSQDEGVKKKAIGVISWTTIGIVIISAAKQIVEAVYGKQEQVLKDGTTVQNLSQVWSNILNPKSIPILFQVINWSLWIISLVLLIIIIMQTYTMLTKPDDEATFKNLKQTIVYALLGLLLIGAAYLIANLLILN